MGSVSRRQLILLLASIIVPAITAGPSAAAEDKAPDFGTFAKSLGEGIDARLKDKKASDSTRKLFSAKDHVAKKYTRNPQLWCADLVPQLTGCAVWKPPLEYVGERYGGVMITSRHILFCKHAHPAWDGGWMKVQPQIIRFVKADNKVVDMTLIANADSPDLDLCVGLLHDEVPEGIHVTPLMPDLSAAQKRELIVTRVPDLSISQASTRPNGERQEAVVYVGCDNSEALRAPWKYDVYQGDSGTPRFLLTSKGLALYQLTGAASISGKLPAIKSLIEACDASAIARGVLKKPTGKLPTVIGITVPAE